MPDNSILSTPEVVARLREWSLDRRRLRVIARLEIVDFSAFCTVDNISDSSFSLLIGEDPRDMFGVYLARWRFAFAPAPMESNEVLPVGGVPESALVGAHGTSTLMLMALRDEPRDI
jgi:hypothetical protein